MKEFEVVIGLEVHAQIKASSKSFCDCPTDFESPPNKNTCSICTGMPGVLPVLNKKVVDYALKAALSLNCKINPYSQFARKNYFYPDLPKGYQISQYAEPLAVNGWLDVTHDGVHKKFRIHRLHLEEDAGKNIHHGEESYLDFNRAGVPLMEIVSEPDFRNPEEAVLYVKELKNILQYLDVCDGNMEKGNLRCDANISLRPKGEKKLGDRTEVKNMNSFKFIERALYFEIERQKEILLEGGRIIQETRLFDSAKGKTMSMRSKEEAHDYRYFPEPDLRPLIIDEKWLSEAKSQIPELRREKKARFIKEFNLPEYDAAILTDSKLLADYFERCESEVRDAKMVSNWIMTELLREFKDRDTDIDNCPVTSSHLAQLLKLMKKGTISGKMAKDIFKDMYNSGHSPLTIVKEKNLTQLDDQGAISEIVADVLKKHAQELERYLKGQDKLYGFFVGQVMQATKGKASPEVVNKVLKDKLGGLKS